MNSSRSTNDGDLSKIFHRTKNPVDLLRQISAAKKIFGENPDINAIAERYGVSQNEINNAVSEAKDICSFLGIKL